MSTGQMIGHKWGNTSWTTSSGSKPVDKSSVNQWNNNLLSAYGAASQSQNGNGAYTSAWNNAVSQAQGLSGKDYTKQLRDQAKETLDQQYTDYGNTLGSMGMRELGLRQDVQNDWSKRRTKADTQAAMDAQSMQQSALETLTNTISGAGGYELDQIAKKLEQVANQISAASAGANAAGEVYGTDVAAKTSKYSTQADLISALLEKYGSSSQGSNLLSSLLNSFSTR